MLTMSTDKNLRIILNLIGKTEDSRQGHSISDSSERLLARRKGGTRIIGVFKKEQAVGTSKDYCYLKKTRYLRS